MRTRSVKLASVLVLAACGTRGADQPVEPTTTVPVPLAAPVMPKVDPIVKGAPHGGDVLEVAVTEEGDAALTADSLNSLRLWPTLDGTRTPVPLQLGSEPAELALMHADRDLVAIVRDRGGGITLMRVGLDGSTRAPRVQLGGDDATFEEVVATGGRIFARTSDHVLEWYDVRGTRKGRLQLEPGRRITDLAARGGRLATIIHEGETRAYMRWVSIAGDMMAWETPLELPTVPHPGMFAIAPTSRRIAYAAMDQKTFAVLDVDLIPTPVVGSTVFMNESYKSLGFLDDDTVGIAGFNIVWWKKAEPEKPASERDDPWEWRNTPVTPTNVNLSGMAPAAAYGDGAAFTVVNSSLLIADPTKARYLGWRVPAWGGFASTSDLVLSQSGAKFTWLDDDLQSVRSIDLQKHRGESSWAYGQPVGSHHVISQGHTGDSTRLDLIDVDHPDTRVEIVKNVQVEQYFIGDGTLAVKIGKKLRRFKLDLAATTVTEMLPAITMTDYSINLVRAFDPTVTNGLVAVAVTWPKAYSEHQALTFYRLVNGTITQERIKRFDGQILRVLPGGDFVIVDRSDNMAKLAVMRDGKIVRTISEKAIVPAPMVDPSATRFVRYAQQDLVMIDDTGKELWRRQLWGAHNWMFSPSGKRLVVAAAGGLLSLDAATGDTVARECGFEFGVHDQAPDVGAMGNTTLCEDPVVQ